MTFKISPCKRIYHYSYNYTTEMQRHRKKTPHKTHQTRKPQNIVTGISKSLNTLLTTGRSQNSEK